MRHFLPSIHVLSSFFRPLLTPVSTAPFFATFSVHGLHFMVCTPWLVLGVALLDWLTDKEQSGTTGHVVESQHPTNSSVSEGRGEVVQDSQFWPKLWPAKSQRRMPSVPSTLFLGHFNFGRRNVRIASHQLFWKLSQATKFLHGV